MIIISKSCISCGVCVDICPVTALKLTKAGVDINKTVCISCGICVHRCPLNAIKVTQASGNNVLIRDVRFQVTGECNFNCPWCFSDAKRPLDDELSSEEAFRMVDELVSCGLKTMTLTGGEPLLRKDFCIGLLKYLHKKGIYTKLFTNGALLDKKTIGDICGIADEVQISEYGKNLLRKLELLFYQLKRQKVRTALRITLTSRNYNRLKGLVKFVGENAVDILRVRPFIAKGRGLEHRELLLDNAAYRKSIGYLVSIRRDKDYFVQLLTPSFPFLYDKYIKPQAFSNLGFRGYTLCKCIEDMGAILPDGSVRACGYFPQDLGSIRKKNFREIWSKNIIKDRLIINSLDEECMRCAYIAICGGGCRANAYINSESLSAPDPNCPRIRHKKK